MNRNKILIIFFLFAFAMQTSYNSNAQYTITPSDTINVYQDFNLIAYYSVNINNTTSDSLQMHWRTLQYDTTGGTYFDFCASGICYTGFPLTGSFPIIAPGGHGWAGAHFRTGNIPVSVTAKVLLTEGLSETGDTVTFILHATNTAGLENIKSVENPFSIYPNPVKDKISIKSNSDKAVEIRILLYNILGEIIYDNKGRSSLTEIPVEKIPEGIYLLKIRSGSKDYVKKVVVSR
ncbi:MAG: T9SS type A sorting domain-containing protein [Bacteroidetes bacterium]|nr:T9SS type A sorting domain-containing protein [Bacteroidota bacterium]